MTPKDYKVARELKNKLSKAVKLLEFRVFGSRVRGTARPSSDMDVFIKVPTLNKKIEKKIRYLVWEVSYENLILITSVIFSQHQLKNTPLRSSPLVRNIMEEGVVI